jgi:hypothetical protein
MRIPPFRSIIKRDTEPVLVAVLKGAVAGLAATWVMDRVTTLLYERENPDARRREDQARGGKTAYGVAAEKAMALAGRRISDEGRERAGAAVHYLTGAAAGASYVLLARKFPELKESYGAAFGAAWFLAVDELANVALGLTPGPRAFPWQAHARGLAGHLVLGVTTDATLRLLHRVA